MSEEIKESVKEYYGKVLQNKADLKTNVCVQQKNGSNEIKNILKSCHEEVLSRFEVLPIVFRLNFQRSQA